MPLQVTAYATIRAELPAGCHRTVYICDDGKDPGKQQPDLAAPLVVLRALKQEDGMSHGHEAAASPINETNGRASGLAAEKAWVLEVNLPRNKTDVFGRTIQALCWSIVDRRFPRSCAAKKAWVLEVNSPELVYISGRTRPAGEINGKSGNLNNALTLIYPPGVDIPLDEVTPHFLSTHARLHMPVHTCPAARQQDASQRGYLAVAPV